MEKYRLISKSDGSLKNYLFYIERKKWYGWREIKKIENGDSHNLYFKTLEDAIAHIVNNYCGSSGTIYQPNPTEIHYTRFSFYV